MYRVLLTIAFMWVWTVGAQAVQPMMMQGAREIALSGSLDDDGEDMGLSLSGRYGFFLVDGVEAGAYGGLGFRGSDSKDLSLGVFGEYNFDQGGALVPYAGGGAGWAWMDRGAADDSYLELQGWGGAKYFFVDYAAIGVELVLKVASEDVYNGYDDGIDWLFRLTTRWFF
ncbi:MAG: hypothetical protein HQ523_05300 [Lentisphaerae bacterium]|nr:hypothetical protein [Lentisphaerota bacterium]